MQHWFGLLNHHEEKNEGLKLKSDILEVECLQHMHAAVDEMAAELLHWQDVAQGNMDILLLALQHPERMAAWALEHQAVKCWCGWEAALGQDLEHGAQPEQPGLLGLLGLLELVHVHGLPERQLAGYYGEIVPEHDDCDCDSGALHLNDKHWISNYADPTWYGCKKPMHTPLQKCSGQIVDQNSESQEDRHLQSIPLCNAQVFTQYLQYYSTQSLYP